MASTAARTYRCAACMGQEWEISTREALFRIRDGRCDINKRRKQNAAFNQASSTIAQNAPGLSRGERRNLAVDLMREAIGPILRFILLKEKALAHRGKLLEQHEDLMERLRGARQLEDIQFWIPDLNKLEDAINAASAAMCLSEVPMSKPVAGVEVALVQDELIVNPTTAQSANATLQLTVAGTKEGILMIEGAADFLSEEVMMAAIKKGHEAIGVICDALAAFQQVAGKGKKTDTLRKLPDGLVDKIDAQFGEEMRQSLSIGDKHERGRSVSKVEAKIVKRFCTDAAPAASSSSFPPPPTLHHHHHHQ
jgi:hypothetical protein